MELRSYQGQSVDDLRGHFRNGFKRLLLVSPTGSGKTVLFVYVAKGAMAKGLRVLILTHRSEIMGQICRTLSQWDVPHATLTAGRKIPKGYSVMVASVQTLGRRLEGSPRPDLVIIDECHHAAAGSWVKIFAEYPDARYLGVTATPERLDGRGLGEFFEKMVLGPRVAWLIENGFLAKPRYFSPQRGVDVSSLKKTAGDFNRKASSEAMDKPSITGDAVDHYRRLAPGRTAVVFCVCIAHAEHVSAQFNAAGIKAEVIEGRMGDEQRQAIIERLRTRVTMILVSVDLVSEGFDLPSVGAVILLRPTASMALHFQQIGRGLRPDKMKEDVIVLDHVGNCARHGLAEEDREWSLDGFSSKRRKKEAILETKQCPTCFAIHAGPVCPECGTVREVKTREIEQREGRLEELTAEKIERARTYAMEEHACNSFQDFVALGQRRGYKPGWAWMRWQRSPKSRRRPSQMFHKAPQRELQFQAMQ